MLSKRLRSTAIALGSFVLIFLFQNCSPQTFSAADLSSMQMGSQTSTSQQSGLSPVSAGGSSNSSSSSGNYSSSNSSNNSLPSSTAAGVPTAANAQGAESCSSYVAMLNWDPNEQYKVEIAGVMNQALDGSQQDIPAYSGFMIAFSSTRMGTHVFNPAKLLMANSGFSIKIEDLESGSTEIPASAFMNPQDTAAKMQAGVSSWNNGAQSVGSRASFFVGRDFYYSNLQKFKTSKVSLLCNKKLVASGIQDVRTLNFEMNTMFTKTATGGYTFKDANRSAFVNINCPLEVKAGSNIQCTVAGVNLESGYWIVDGKEERSADDKTTFVMTNAAAGNHTFQVVVKYKGGLEDRSEMFLVKAR